MIVTCEDCGETICSDCDGSHIGSGRYVCEDCNDERERLNAEAQVANLPVSAEPMECGNCGIITRAWIAKNEGIRCVPCAHALEIELIGGEHDVVNCRICTPFRAGDLNPGS